MNFDPTKKFGTIHGRSSAYPRAKYEQGGYMFDANHKCLNPDSGKEAHDDDIIKNATRELLTRKQLELEEATNAVVAAQQELDADNTAPNKAKLTKAKNRYTTIASEIAELGG